VCGGKGIHVDTGTSFSGLSSFFLLPVALSLRFVVRFVSFLQIDLVEQPFDREKNIKKGFCFITFESGDPVDVICASPKHHVGGRDVCILFAVTATYKCFSFHSSLFSMSEFLTGRYVSSQLIQT